MCCVTPFGSQLLGSSPAESDRDCSRRIAAEENDRGATPENEPRSSSAADHDVQHPTAKWTAQQIAEWFPFNTAPRFLLRDGDGIYGDRVCRAIDSHGIDDAVTAPASPWQKGYVSLSLTQLP